MRGTAQQVQGWSKLKGLCDLVLASNRGENNGLHWVGQINYVWMDTCCINKESSAELSEAINSMYRWYHVSRSCVAFLYDVSVAATMWDSEWFKRGWTLQELLAPADVLFYNKDWKHLGSRFDLHSKIASITGISQRALQWGFAPEEFSVAERMSWAAARKTTRPEDRAYSLFGMFGVNMPLLYGEGDRAFHRLQMTIMQSSQDASILAWTPRRHDYHGLLAQSPESFFRSDGSTMIRPYSLQNIFAFGNRAKVQEQCTVESSTASIMTLVLIPYSLNTYLAPVSLLVERHQDIHVFRRYARGESVPLHPEDTWLCVTVQRDARHGTFNKTNHSQEFLLRHDSPGVRQAHLRTISLQHSWNWHLAQDFLDYIDAFTITSCKVPNYTTQMITKHMHWPNTTKMELGDYGIAGILRLHATDLKSTTYLLFSFDLDWNVCLLSLTFSEVHTSEEALLTFPHIRKELFQLFNNDDMLELIHRMQELGLTTGSRYNFSLRQIPWSETRERVVVLSQDLRISVIPNKTEFSIEKFRVRIDPDTDVTAVGPVQPAVPADKWYVKALVTDINTDTSVYE